MIIKVHPPLKLIFIHLFLVFISLISFAQKKSYKDSLIEYQQNYIATHEVVGKEDKITPIAAAQQMHEKILNSKLEIIQQAGHLSNLENLTAFNTHLVNFLETVGKRSFSLSDIDGN